MGDEWPGSERRSKMDRKCIALDGEVVSELMCLACYAVENDRLRSVYGNEETAAIHVCCPAELFSARTGQLDEI